MLPAAALGALALAALAVAPGPAAAAAVAFAPPQVVTLENGLRVAVFPDPRLPIVQCALRVPAGSTAEPAGREGLANLTALGLREGTSSRTSGAFSADLERLGANLAAGAGRDYATVTASFLSRDLDGGLELLADAATHAVFPDEDVSRLKRRVAVGLAAGQLDPGAAADERLWAAVFRGHPYGRAALGTPEAMDKISADDLRAFHRDRYRPDGAVLAIAGDVTPERALSAAREWFGSWAGRAAEVPAPGAPAASGAAVVIVDRPDLARAEIRLGAPTAARDAPDYLALALANHCLGGPGGSRLAAGAGLTDARSVVTPLRGTGLIALAASAPPESARAVADRLRAGLLGLRAAGPRADELERARRYFRNVFPLSLETLSARVSQWLAVDFYGLPADFFARYDATIAALGPDPVAAAAKRWLDPARLVVVAVGPASRLRPVLESLGTVEVIAPAAAPAAASGFDALTPATPEQERRGRELFARAIATHGGEERLAGIKDSRIEGELVVSQGGRELRGSLRQLRKEPERMLFVTRFDNFEARQYLNGGRAWSTTGPDTLTVLDADSLLLAGQRARFRSDLPHLLLLGRDPRSQVFAQGSDTIAGRPAEAVRLDGPGGERRRYYFDSASGRLLAIDEPAPPGLGRVARRIYSDYRTVDGVLWPMSEERQMDGQRIMRVTARTVALNPGIPDALFERPARAHPAGPAGP